MHLEHSLCTEDASTVLKVPVELPIAAVVQANLLKAKSLYKAGTLAKKAYQLNTEKSHTWKLQLQYVRQYRTAAVSFAYALELMNENEFNSEMHQCNVELAVCLHEVLAAQRSDCQLKTCCLCWKNCQVGQRRYDSWSCTSEDFTVVLPVFKAWWRYYLSSYRSKEVLHRLTSERTGSSMLIILHW